MTFYKGQIFTEEHRKHLRESHIGLHCSVKTEIKKGGHLSTKTEFKVGHKVGMTGKKHAIESKAKMRLAQLGEKSHMWRGGITPINELVRASRDLRMWRESVYKRDDKSCLACGNVSAKRYNAHHIYNFSRFPNLRFDVNNGVTLCKDCHSEFHKRYGFSSNNRSQLNDFIKSL
jgi:hypothetical protein